MWPEIVAYLPEFASAILSGRDGDGYPFSVRCRPEVDPRDQVLRLRLGPDLPLRPGPASLLCHRHDELLWSQRSFLVRGDLSAVGDAWVFRPTQFIPGAGIGGLRGLLRFVRESRRAADRYLAARGLERPPIPWAEINAVKPQVPTTIDVRRPIEQVFDYVTTPANWLVWHPASLGLRGATDHSLDVGEQVVEEFRVAGRRGAALWTVRERQAPRRWVIDGRARGGGGATITYTLTPIPGGTRFLRELVYRVPNLPLALLDRLALRRRVAAESAEALRRLKRALESGL